MGWGGGGGAVMRANTSGMMELSESRQRMHSSLLAELSEKIICKSLADRAGEPPNLGR